MSGMHEKSAEAAVGIRPRALYVQTFGCQMNEYDSMRVAWLLENRGYRRVEDPHRADVIFLNTCSVREKAEQKIYSLLGRLRKLKHRNPDLKIIVAGCVAQQLGEKLLERFPHLDLVVGTRGVGAVPELLDRLWQDGNRTAYLPDDEGETSRHYPPADGTPLRSGVVAPVTIMQGCDNFCTYCIVPYVRGRERSRPSGDVLREIKALEDGGAREVLLLGQNVNSYGRGLTERIDFSELIRKIAGETNLSRIRFTTSHPKDLTESLIRCFAEIPALCKHIHLPFQAGSDRVLRRMNRRYTAADYEDKVRRLRDACPEIGLSADVMVGFPGESDEDFEKTLELMERIRFDTLFSFRYSDRPFARSSGFSGKVPEDVKSRRLAILQGLQAEITLEKNRLEIGGIREVLVEGPSRAGGGQFTGRTQQNRIVNFQGDETLVGRCVKVRITDAFSHSLRGEWNGGAVD